MTKAQREKLKKLKNRIIALLPKWGVYTPLMVLLMEIALCKDEDEIEEKITKLESLIQQSENFVIDMNAIVQKPETTIPKKETKEPKNTEKPNNSTIKRKSRG